MEQARTLPGCDTEERAEIYREIQTILQEDPPYVWLYSANDMIVADGGVLGFDPRPGRPFWNIRDWIVVK
jgi:ABC-type transport system substrate-binding protein